MQGDISFDEVKEKYLRPYYLPGSFIIGTTTVGLNTSLVNFSFSEDPFGFIVCSMICGAIITAIAWVLFDFTETGNDRR